MTTPGPDDRDPLLDPPEGAPGWLPSVDRERSLRWLWRGVLAVLVLGVAAFVVRGADEPADPELGDPVGPASTTEAPAVQVPGSTEDGEEAVDDGGVIAPAPEGVCPAIPTGSCSTASTRSPSRSPPPRGRSSPGACSRRSRRRSASRASWR